MPDIDAVQTRATEKSDLQSISVLHAKIFGPGRFARTAYRVREGSNRPHDVTPFCRIATLHNILIASITFTEIQIGGTPGALLLGPVAVDPEFIGKGIGRTLITQGLEAARAAGRSSVLLVGDEPYYSRFGFKSLEPGRISLPGPVDPKRLLGLNLQAEALSQVHGVVMAC